VIDHRGSQASIVDDNDRSTDRWARGVVAAGGQSLEAASGQIVMAAHTNGATRATLSTSKH
jgi:hypothetical protein